MTAGRGRISKQLLNNLKERRRYLKLKDETLDHTVWRILFEKAIYLFIYLLLIYLSILHILRNCQGFQHHIALRDTALSV